MKHLGVGKEETALCGAERKGSVHPSKGGKDACPDCKRIWKERKAKKDEPVAEEEVTVSFPGLVTDDDAEAMAQQAPTGFVADRDVERFKMVPPVQVPVKDAPKPVEIPPVLDRRWRPTTDEVARVKALRAAGHSYVSVEKEMGWPDFHGNRAWRVDKGMAKAR